MASSDLSWVKISVHIAANPKLASVAPGACWLYVCLLCYCGEHLTDGFVDRAAFARVSRMARARSAHASQLVHAHLIEPVANGYAIPDYLEWNRSREEVDAKRQYNASRMRRVRGNKDDADGPRARERARAQDAHARDACALLEVEVETETEVVIINPSLTRGSAQGVDDDEEAGLPDDDAGPDLLAELAADIELTRDELVAEALDVLAQRDLDEHVRRGGRVTAPDRFLRSCRSARERDAAPALYALAYANPACSPAELADLLGRAPTSDHPGSASSPPSPADPMAAAMRAQHERNARRAAGTACPKCDDAGVYLDEHDMAHECPCRFGVTVDVVEAKRVEEGSP